MSLAARIAIAPSRGLALAEAAMLVGGSVLVAATTTMRLAPDGVVVVVAFVTVAASAAARRVFTTRIARPVRVVVTSDRSEVELGTVDGPDDGGPWRLRESTLCWPGLSVVSVEPVEPGASSRALDLPALHSELTPADAWALSRYLRWRSA